MSAEYQFPEEILRIILSHVSDPETVAALKSIPELKEIAEQCCYSRVSSLSFSVHARNADSDGNILTSEVGIDGKAPIKLSKNEALVLFLELQDKAKHLHSLKIESQEGSPNPDMPHTACLTFGAQTMEILRDVSVTYLRESSSVKELAVNVYSLQLPVYNNDPSIWLLIVSIIEKCPNVEFLELQVCPPEADYRNLKQVCEGPNASHLKRVKLTRHPFGVEFFVDFEHSTVNFPCNEVNIRRFLSLQQSITAFENIKNVGVTKIFAFGESQQLKNLFLKLTETVENVSVELKVVVPPSQGAADLQTILNSGHPKQMFEWMGAFLGRARGLNFNENKLTVELTISLRKETEKELEGLVNAYNGGMQHPFSGEVFPFECDTSTVAHPVSMEMVKGGQWIEDLWVVRKGNKVAVLNLKFKFV